MTQTIPKTNKVLMPQTLYFTDKDWVKGLCPLLFPLLCLLKNYLQKKNPSPSGMESHLTLVLAFLLACESPSILF